MTTVQAQSASSQSESLGVDDIAGFDETTSSPIPLQEIYRPGFEAPANAPKECSRVLFKSQSGEFVSGVWQGEPGTFSIENYPVDEFCMVIEGEVTLTDQTGKSRTFKRGMAFVIPRGFVGTWHMPVRSKKYFAGCSEPELIDFLMGQPRP